MIKRFLIRLTMALSLCAAAVSLPLPAQAKTGEGSWSDGAALNQPRAGLRVVAVDGRVYAAGGSGKLEPLNEFSAYDTASRSWRNLAPLPTGLERFGMAALGSQVCVAGGVASDQRGESNARAWCYDTLSDNWISIADLPEGRTDFALVGYQNRLYAIGGTSDAVDIYDPALDTWKRSPGNGALGRFALSADVLGDRIIVVGGVDDAGPSARVDILNPADMSWTAGPALPVGRADHAVAVSDQGLHVMGGRGGASQVTLDDHWVLETVTGRWAKLASLPSPRTAFGAAGDGAQIFAVGGGAGAGFFAPFTAIADLDIYAPSEPS